MTNNELKNEINVDLDDESSFLMNLTNTYAFQSNVWMFMNSEINRKLLENLRPEFNTRIYLVTILQESIDVSEIYSISSLHEIVIQKVMKFNQISKTNIDKADFIWTRRNDLQGVKWTTTIINAFGYASIKDYNKLSESYGFTIDLLMSLSQELNFTLEFVSPVKKSFGSKDNKGNYNGMVGMLQRGEADLTGVLIRETLARSEVLDYSKTIRSYSNIFIAHSASNHQQHSYLDMVEFDAFLTLAGVASALVIMASFVALGEG